MTSLMTEAALANDKALGVPLVHVDRVYLDHEFNCRGHFAPTDCVELAENIASVGLQSPVTVRAIRKENQIGIDADPPTIQAKYDYVALAGHRRITAYRINKAELIPAIIKDAYIDDFTAHDLNAIENIQRVDLNIAQEAQAIRHYWIAGWVESDVAKRVNKSRGWVQQRYQLLTMPQEVQIAAAQGYIIGSDLKELYRYRSDVVELLKAARQIKEKREKGQSKNVAASIKKPDKASSAKHRRAKEILDLQTHLRETFQQCRVDKAVMVDDLISPYGNCLATKMLAWCAGEINSYEVHKSVQEFCQLFGYHYPMPKFTPEHDT